MDYREELKKSVERKKTANMLTTMFTDAMFSVMNEEDVPLEMRVFKAYKDANNAMEDIANKYIFLAPEKPDEEFIKEQKQAIDVFKRVNLILSEFAPNE